MNRPHSLRIRHAVLPGICVLVVGLSGGTAQAAPPYPPAAPVCTVSPDQPAADSSVSVSCTGFDPGTPVVVTSGGNDMTATSSAITDSSGGTTVRESTGAPGNASWRMVGRLPGGAAGKGVARATVNHRRSLNTTHVREQVGAISQNPVRVGQEFTFSGCGYKPGTTETTTDTAGDSFGTTTVGPDGCFHKTMVMAAAGNFTLVGTGEASAGGTLLTTANLTVEAAAGLELGYTGGLAFTGTDGIGVMVVIGCGLLAAGTGLVARSRRRQLVHTV